MKRLAGRLMVVPEGPRVCIPPGDLQEWSSSRGCAIQRVPVAEDAGTLHMPWEMTSGSWGKPWGGVEGGTDKRKECVEGRGLAKQQQEPLCCGQGSVGTL